MTDEFNPKRLTKALRKLSDMYPPVEIDFGDEIERANRLMERTDGSFYQRGPRVDDGADEDRAYDESREE